jgi:hypothetical protein
LGTSIVHLFALPTTTLAIDSCTEPHDDGQDVLDQFFVFLFILRSFKHRHGATNAVEKPLDGSEPEAGEPVSMLYYDSFDFTPAGCIYNLKELATIVIQAGSNL